MTPSSGEGVAPSREDAIRWLRPRLRELCGANRSLCRVAAERRIFCHGFRRWHDREFHRRFASSLGVSTHLTRRQMETLADLWQLTEQLRLHVAVPCDAANLEPGACRGWNELTDDELREACLELSEAVMNSPSGANDSPGTAVIDQGLDSNPMLGSSVAAAYSKRFEARR